MSHYSVHLPFMLIRTSNVQGLSALVITCFIQIQASVLIGLYTAVCVFFFYPAMRVTMQL